MVGAHGSVVGVHGSMFGAHGSMLGAGGSMIGADGSTVGADGSVDRSGRFRLASPRLLRKSGCLSRQLLTTDHCQLTT